MSVKKPIYAGEEVFVSMSRDKLLVALRLCDVARVIGMVEGGDMDALVHSAGMDQEVWANPLSQDRVSMISLEGAHAVMKAKGTDAARCFSAWLHEQFPENAAISESGRDQSVIEMLRRIGEMRLENPGIEPRAAAFALGVSESEAQRYITYLDLLNKLK